MSAEKGWIGVDLDGTLAFYDYWRGIGHIGAPIPLMVERVNKWIKEGREVRIFTARVAPSNEENRDNLNARGFIREWCVTHLGAILPVTCVKDFGMIELWDDRAVPVMKNTGEIR